MCGFLFVVIENDLSVTITHSLFYDLMTGVIFYNACFKDKFKKSK